MKYPIVEIKDLSVDFMVEGAIVHGLKKINLQVPKGTIVGLVGESGSAKTTLINCITQLMDSNAYVSGGHYTFDGRNMEDRSPSEMRRILGKDISMIFQDPMNTLNPILTIEKQMTDIQYRLNISYAEKKKRAIRALNRVGIPEPDKRLPMYPFEFSGGQCQRISIAMATMMKPKLLLADEPTTALDATLQLQILDLLKSMQEELQCTMLFVSHHLGLVATLCDYVGVMRYGGLLEFGRVKDIFTNPQHEYTQQLIACDPAIIKEKVTRFPTMGNGRGSSVGIPSDSYIEQRIQTMQQIDRNTNLLELKDVQVRFGEQSLWNRLSGKDTFFYAVKGVSFAVKSSETVAIVGESGSGKTTLARGILRLLDICEGDITFQGKSIPNMTKKEIAAMRNEVVMIFQDPIGSLNPRKKVKNILFEPYIIQHIRIKNHKAEVKKLLGMVGLDDEFADRYPHQLSGGQARRVGVAQALALGPKLIVADEPTSGLDVSIQGEVLNIIMELKEKLGNAMLIITHNLNIVRHVADRVLIMYGGEILEQGDTAHVFEHPQHEYTKKLLAANSYAIKHLK